MHEPHFNSQVSFPATRRKFLGISSLSLATLGAFRSPFTSIRGAAAENSPGRAKRCVLLFLTGGPPQIDTWDPKPAAPVEIRGELKPIATESAGLFFTELFPRLASTSSRLCVLRSITHGDTVHTSAGYTMLTGVVHPQANSGSATLIKPGPNDHPHVGSLVSRFLDQNRSIPPMVSLPEIIKDAQVNQFPGLDGGFLGSSYSPLLVEANAARTAFLQPDIFLPADVSSDRLQTRRQLLDLLNEPSLVRSLGEERSRETVRWRERAYRLVESPAFREAFDLGQESPMSRDAYGSHLFGKGCLLARRLLEAGVTFVSVYWHYEGPDDSPVWDTHGNNFPHLRERLAPPTDQAVAALVSDLANRGMLDDTLVICMGEFGRSPKINREAGRDHWPRVQSILLSGAGIRTGVPYGSSDKYGSDPADHAVTPADLTATILHLLGVPGHVQLQDPFGRPIPACSGNVISGLF